LTRESRPYLDVEICRDEQRRHGPWCTSLSGCTQKGRLRGPERCEDEREPASRVVKSAISSMTHRPSKRVLASAGARAQVLKCRLAAKPQGPLCWTNQEKQVVCKMQALLASQDIGSQEIYKIAQDRDEENTNVESQERATRHPPRGLFVCVCGV
jgi:hypothetical protein